MNMLPSAAVNIIMIRRVAIQLGNEIRPKVMFVGGAAVALLLTDPAAPDVRPTKDVDIVVEVMSYGEYDDPFCTTLRERGFNEDTEGMSPVICRWRMQDLIVDIMPAGQNIFGFSNRWYKAGLDASFSIVLPNQESDSDTVVIRLISAPYFVATKLEAYKDRGKNDLYGSHDMEDIVTLLNGRTEVIDDIRSEANLDLIRFISTTFGELLADDRFSEAVEGHLSERDRHDIVMEKFKAISVL